jgi:hypothetical protein
MMRRTSACPPSRAPSRSSSKAVRPQRAARCLQPPRAACGTRATRRARRPRPAASRWPRVAPWVDRAAAEQHSRLSRCCWPRCGQRTLPSRVQSPLFHSVLWQLLWHHCSTSSDPCGSLSRTVSTVRLSRDGCCSGKSRNSAAGQCPDTSPDSQCLQSPV